MNIKTLSSFALACVSVFVISGCHSSAPTISSGQVSKESTATQQYKDRLKGMSKDQIAAEFKADPQRAQALLLPPGMGDPRLRLHPGGAPPAPAPTNP